MFQTVLSPYKMTLCYVSHHLLESKAVFLTQDESAKFHFQEGLVYMYSYFRLVEGFKMAEESNYSSSENNDDEDYLERPMPKQFTSLFGNVIGKSASKAIGAVEAGASYVISPIVSPPNVWPNMDNIDNLVHVLTMTGYAFTAFSIVGTTYFLTRTTREIWQWRHWSRYRRIMKKNSIKSSQ